MMWDEDLDLLGKLKSSNLQVHMAHIQFLRNSNVANETDYY